MLLLVVQGTVARVLHLSNTQLPLDQVGGMFCPSGTVAREFVRCFISHSFVFFPRTWVGGRCVAQPCDGLAALLAG